MVTGESDEWTDDGHGALHPFSATEHCRDYYLYCRDITPNL
jgi:hypothetical protein